MKNRMKTINLEEVEKHAMHETYIMYIGQHRCNLSAHAQDWRAQDGGNKTD